jgi:hypothetical protein
MAAKIPSGAPERASYRVSYPAGYPERRQVLAILEPDTPVGLQDWSETGVRIDVPDPTILASLAVHDVVRLTLTPHAFDVLRVEGIIVRIDGSSVSVRLKSPGLPWKLMIHEQRAILAWQSTLVESLDEREAKTRNSLRTIDELS